MVGQPKTESGRRTIALSGDTMDVLRAHLERQEQERLACGIYWKGSGYVLTSSIGTPLTPGNLSRKYKSLQRLAGVSDIRLHDLRHTSASIAVRRGDNAKQVSERLGHSKVGFTLDTYVKTFSDQRREAALGMADLTRPKN